MPVSRSVYWRRRAVVLGLPLVLVLLAVWLIGGRGSGDGPAAAATPTKTATPTKAAAQTKAGASPSTTGTPKPTNSVPDCSSLKLDVSADAKSYNAGANPKLTTTITNTGAKACLVDAGSANTLMVITSGDDQVWSSRDCVASSSESKPLLLSAGKSVSGSVSWKRVRSAPGCPKNPGAAKPGTYAVTYTVAGQNAAPAVIRLR
ncbi:MAG: hypothetical protein AAGC49_04550 [Brevundimonas sp.]